MKKFTLFLGLLFATMLGFSQTNLTVAVDFTATGIDEVASETVNIYPNPAVDFIMISSQSEISLLEIYSYNGQLMAQIQVHDKNYRLNTSAYPTGVYSVLVKTVKNETIGKRLIIR